MVPNSPPSSRRSSRSRPAPVGLGRMSEKNGDHMNYDHRAGCGFHDLTEEAFVTYAVRHADYRRSVIILLFWI